MPTASLVATKTVVVADDTAFVRDRFRGAIESAGHRALVAGSEPELMAVLREHAGRADLLALDLHLPHAHGLDTVRAVRTIAPAAPILVFSGTITSTEEARALETLGVSGYINEYTSAQHILPSLAPYLFPEHYTRRSSPRVALGIGVSYRFGNTVASGLTRNISKGGLAIRTTSPVTVGEVVKIRMRLPASAKDIDAETRVAWVEHGIGMGLEFTAISDEQRATVDEWVQSHFFSNRKA